MSNATLDQPMAEEKRKTLSVKLDADVVELARIVTAYSGETITDQLSSILRPILAKIEQDTIAKRIKPKGGKP